MAPEFQDYAVRAWRRFPFRTEHTPQEDQLTKTFHSIETSQPTSVHAFSISFCMFSVSPETCHASYTVACFLQPTKVGLT